MPLLPTRAAPPPTALGRFLEPYHSLVRRSESRHALESYVAGLQSDAVSKTATEIARVIPGTSSQRLQEFLTRTSWSDAELNRRRVEQLVAAATAGDGVQVLVQVMIPKAGTHSVGASRQCRGPRGGALNCQRLVTAHYADDVFEWPVAARLYLPREWTDDAERRLAARIPEDAAYRTPAQLALDLARAGWAQGIPAGTLVADASFGDDAEFLDGVEREGRPYLVQRTSLDGVQVVAPTARPDARAGRGSPLQELARVLSEDAWRRVGWRDSDGLPRVQEFARLAASRSGEAGHDDGVLLLARAVGGGEPMAYYGSGLAARELDQLVRLAARLGAPRAFYDDEARALGLDDYEGRLWAGFNRHVALVFLASAHRLLTRAYAR